MPKTCSRCGAEIPAGAAECPGCMLRLGIQDPRPAPAEDPPPAADHRSPPLPPPTLEEVRAAFPELEIEELLGRGGMGAVFRARQRKLERKVALKVLPPGLAADPTFAERFLREARALARLSHPGIVTVHDYGESGGFWFLVMELVDGLDLRRLIRQGPLETRQALAIARDLCDALQYAHDEGVVHRDVKPENVLVDARGRAKIADFGLAKIVGASADGLLTRTDQVMGTPHYMAPEQLERPRDVDHRADIFALGVVLYEMLTGSLPRGNFEPPSRRVHVDVRLDEIVLKALERQPERRYQQALEVRTDVDDVSTKPAAAARSAAKPTPGHRRHRLGGLRAFAVLVAAWITFGALWNLGGFAFGAGYLVVAIALGVALDQRLRAEPELQAQLEAEPNPKKGTRLIVLLGPLIGGISAIAGGHYFNWEEGTHAWKPAYVRVAGAFEALKVDVPAGVQPQLVMTKDYTSENVVFWDAFPPWVLIGIGLVLLGIAILNVTFVQEHRRTSYQVTAAVLSGVLGAIFLLRIGAPFAPLGEASLTPVERRIETEWTPEEADDRLRLAFRRAELRVDVEQRLLVRDLRTGDDVLPIVLNRAQAGSPFERFATGWAGPRRRTPQVWATIVPRENGSTILLQAGSYDSASPEAAVAEAALAGVQKSLRDG